MPEVVQFILIITVLLVLGGILLWIWRPDLLGGAPNTIGSQLWQKLPHPIQGGGLTGGRGGTQRPMSDYFLQLLPGSPSHRLPSAARFQLRQGNNKIGRQPRNEDHVYLIALPHDTAISRDHAYLIFDQQQGAFIWENRENSVWINDEFMAAGQQRLLQTGDRIRIGNTLLEFARQSSVVPSPQVAPGDIPTVNPHIGTPASQLAGGATIQSLLRVVKGAQLGQYYILAPQHGRIQVGRTEENHWALQDPKISRHHAQFYFDGSTWNVFDLDSRWGLKVNGTPAKNHALRYGDLVTLGETVIRYEHIGQSPPTVR